MYFFFIIYGNINNAIGVEDVVFIQADKINVWTIIALITTAIYFAHHSTPRALNTASSADE